MMNCNWFTAVMFLIKNNYSENPKLKGMSIIINEGGVTLEIGDDRIINSSFLSKLDGLYSLTSIVTRKTGAH